MQVTMSTTNHKGHDVFLSLHVVMRHRYSPDNHRGARGRCGYFVIVVTLHL
jgi:hypothetical protein